MAALEPLPDEWRNIVVPILRRGSSSEIEWTFRASQDWQQFGMQFEAYDYLVDLFSKSNLSSRSYPHMTGARNIRAVLGPHPISGITTKMYVKIGLLDNDTRIKIFSLHIDLSGDMERQMNEGDD